MKKISQKVNLLNKKRLFINRRGAYRTRRKTCGMNSLHIVHRSEHVKIHELGIYNWKPC